MYVQHDSFVQQVIDEQFQVECIPGDGGDGGPTEGKVMIGSLRLNSYLPLESVS